MKQKALIIVCLAAALRAFGQLPDTVRLRGVVVTARQTGTSDYGARNIERQAAGVMNVMSEKAIGLSPDISVGNLVQRMSGVAVERNSSGEGQYAILRGMDKRYNYTLVNGVKIPSPDNKNRYVPLDLFPSEILGRLEVYKSLTPDLEGDGIGGAVNLVMKDAPSRPLFSASLSTGYNGLFLGRDFHSFRPGDIASKSPDELRGNIGDNAVGAADFSARPWHIKSARPLPDILGSLAWGGRAAADRFGYLLAANYQRLYRGKDMDYYNYTSAARPAEERRYSNSKDRLALHARADWRLTPLSTLYWYGGAIYMGEDQVRTACAEREGDVRLRHNTQWIWNTTLSGRHFLLGKALTVDWRGVFAHASNRTPDQTLINFQGQHIQTNNAATRRWQHNSDRDLAAYADIAYVLCPGLALKSGGMYRDKRRSSFFNEYTFDSATGTDSYQVRGEDWTNLDQIELTPRRYGNVGDPLNYDATERVGAAYAMATFTTGPWTLIGGLRAEHTSQGYHLLFPRNVDPDGQQDYWDFLPSLHAKYKLGPSMQLHLSYARAINRPSFFEIVPYTIINEEYKEKGNPALQHSTADNFDLRWEYFPDPTGQVMAGLFYKHIQNPIEYGLINEGQDTYYMPMNMGNADNAGLELDLQKYWGAFGVKANYTLTISRIATMKRHMDGGQVVQRKQTRPLYGQAANVANLSLIYRQTAHRLNIQLTTSYIGKRLADISNWYDNDIWENDYVRLELSGEKAWSSGIKLFVKATNLLNLPMVRYINKGPHTDGIPDVDRYRGNITERRERYGQTLIVGLRYNL